MVQNQCLKFVLFSVTGVSDEAAPGPPEQGLEQGIVRWGALVMAPGFKVWVSLKN